MRIRPTTLAVISVVIAAGCVNYDERIELNTDGSGLVRMHLAISEQVLRMTGRPQPRKEEDLLPMPREELVRELEADHFKVRSLRAESAQGLRHFYIVLEFKSLDDLAKSEYFGGRKVSLKRDGAKWRCVQEINVSEKTLTDRAGPKPTEEEKTPDGKQPKRPGETGSVIRRLEARFGKTRVRQMFAAYSLSFSVELAGAGLIRTNGVNYRDRTAVWEISLDRLIDTKPTLHMEADFAIDEVTPPPKEE